MAGVNGSSAFGEVARAVFGFAKDPESDGNRIMSQAKNSTGEEDLALTYCIESHTVTTDSGKSAAVGRFVITGDSDRTARPEAGIRQVRLLHPHARCQSPAATVHRMGRPGGWQASKRRTVSGARLRYQPWGSGSRSRKEGRTLPKRQCGQCVPALMLSFMPVGEPSDVSFEPFREEHLDRMTSIRPGRSR